MSKRVFVFSAVLAAVNWAFANPGDLDSTFGQNGRTTLTIPGTSTSESGSAVAIQADGKAVVAGSANNNIAIMRLNTDGSLDTTFGFGGKVASSAGYEGDAVAIQADGKIVVGGIATVGNEGRFMIARYLANGDIDQSFGTLGSTTISFGNPNATSFLHAVAIQSDGKIIAVGQATETEADFGVVRLNSDGSPDSTFGNGGKVTTDFPGPNGPFDAANAVTVQSDGKILVAGVSNSQSTGDTFAVARYLTNGALDASFGTSGLTTFTFGSRHTAAYAIGFQSSGQIIVGGETEGTGTDGNTGGVTLARLNPNGTLDSSFGTGGIAAVVSQGAVQMTARAMIINPDDTIWTAGSLQLSGQSVDYLTVSFSKDGAGANSVSYSANPSAAYDEETHAAARQNDGRVILVGFTNQNDASDIGVLRVRTDQRLDRGFNSSGVTAWGFFDAAASHAVALQSDGKIIAAGRFVSSGRTTAGVARLDIGGVLDKSFSDPSLSFGTTGNSEANATAIQSDGKIVLAGYNNNGVTTDFALWRINSLGNLDTSFDGSGGTTTNFGGSTTNVARSVLVQSDGKIVIGGTSDARLAVQRLLPDGSLDNAFGNAAGVIIHPGTQDDGAAILIQPDGQLIVIGTSDGDFVAARLHVDGSLDPTFGNGGVARVSFGNGHAAAAVMDSAGRVIIAGDAGGDFALVRLLGSGVADSSFGSNGKVFTDFGGTTDIARGIALLPDGRIAVAGNSAANFAVAVYETNGQLSNSFGGAGWATTSIFNSTNTNAAAIAIQSDGRIVVAGSEVDPTDGTEYFALARFNSDGSLDKTYGGGSGPVMSLGGFPVATSGTPGSLTVQSDDRIVFCGTNDVFNSSDTNHYCWTTECRWHTRRYFWQRRHRAAADRRISTGYWWSCRAI